MKKRTLFVAFAAVMAAVLPALAAEKEALPVVHMGMIQTLFRGSETGMMLAQSGPLGDILLSQTRLKGQIDVVEDPAEMVRKIQDGELDIAVIHGVEYAWERKQHPDVQPLVVACNQEIALKAFIMVKADSDIKTVADLHGKPFSFTRRSLNHCYLYLHKAIKDAGCEPANFFGPSPIPSNMEQALDAVIDGDTAGTIVDGVAWSVYSQRKPARAKKLRAICESSCFPTATVIYNAKTHDPRLIERVHDGLISSDQTALGRQMLTLWRLTQFREVPAEYDSLLTEVVKTYPTRLVPAHFFPEPVKTTAPKGE